MSKKNFLGVALCIAIFVGGFWLSGGLQVFWNLGSFLIVTAGLCAALFLSYPYARIRTAFQVARSVYTERQATPDAIVRILLELSVKSRVEGLLSLEGVGKKIADPFLRNAVAFLVDNYREHDIREFLNTEMAFFRERRQQSERVFQMLAKAAPAFGVAGSVIGLIGMLSSINDTQGLVSSIPVAFVSTLYGVVLSNMFLAPIAESIDFHTNASMFNQKLIMEGVIAIATEQNTHRLEQKLMSFLPPSQRAGKAEFVRAITKKYITRRRAERSEFAKTEPARSDSAAAVARAFNDAVPMPQPREEPATGLHIARLQSAPPLRTQTTRIQPARTPSLHVAPPLTAPTRTQPLRTASLRTSPLHVAPAAPPRSASLRTASLRAAPLRTASARAAG